MVGPTKLIEPAIWRKKDSVELHRRQYVEYAMVTKRLTSLYATGVEGNCHGLDALGVKSLLKLPGE